MIKNAWNASYYLISWYDQIFEKQIAWFWIDWKRCEIVVNVCVCERGRILTFFYSITSSREINKLRVIHDKLKLMLRCCSVFSLSVEEIIPIYRFIHETLNNEWRFSAFRAYERHEFIVTHYDFLSSFNMLVSYILYYFLYILHHYWYIHIFRTIHEYWFLLSSKNKTYTLCH